MLAVYSAKPPSAAITRARTTWSLGPSANATSATGWLRCWHSWRRAHATAPYALQAYGDGGVARANYANSEPARRRRSRSPDGPSDHVVRARVIAADGGFAELHRQHSREHVAPSNVR